MLDRLRNKEKNVLFATSVVEEGVDVESCSFVIAFDSIKTTKSYVQVSTDEMYLLEPILLNQNQLSAKS